MSFLSKAGSGPCLLLAMLAATSSSLVTAQELPEVQKLVERGELKQALAKVNQHLTARPNSIDARFLKGVILAESNDPAQAIAIFAQLTQDAPQLLEAYNNLGALYARQQHYDKARVTLEAALKLDPALSAVTGNLRHTYGSLAKQAYDKALGHESGPAPQASKNLVLLNKLRAPTGAPGKALETGIGKPVAVAALPAMSTTASLAVPQPFSPVAVTAETPSTPAASESKSGTTPPSPHADVRRAVDNWSQAWMRKDMKAYLAAYAPDFSVPRGQSRKDWERERTQRILGKRDRIQIEIEKPEVLVQDGVAKVKFLQHYQAGSFKNSTVKLLTLASYGGKWRIKSEK